MKKIEFLDTYLMTHPQIIQALLGAGAEYTDYDPYRWTIDDWHLDLMDEDMEAIDCPPYWTNRQAAVDELTQAKNDGDVSIVDPQLINQIPANYGRVIFNPQTNQPAYIVAGDDVLDVRKVG